MKTIEQGFEWLWNHKPDIAFVTVIGACIVWITSTVINFNVRMDNMDKRFNDVDQRFNAVDKRFDKMDQRLDKMDERFNKIDNELIEIRLVLKKIDTYLTTTSPTYK